MNFGPEHSHPPQAKAESMVPQHIFQSLLQATEVTMHSATRDDIGSLRRYFEQKVYLSYSDDSSQYLLHMLHKAPNSTQDYVLEKVRERELGVLTDIKLNKYQVKQVKEDDKIKQIREELADKINDIRHSMNNLEGSRLEEESEATYKRLMEFRKKGYWKEDSDQSKQVAKFISNMKEKKKEVEKLHKKQVQQMEASVQKAEEQGRKKREQQEQEVHRIRLQKLRELKEKREKEKEEKEDKLEMASGVVKKYQAEKPIYIINAETFQKEVLGPMEEERKRKLQEWKKSKKPIDAEEIELHQQWYEQFKEQHSKAMSKKEQDIEIEEKNMERLNELFHGRFHTKIKRQKNPVHDRLDVEKQKREKVISYSVSVKEGYKPPQDPRKKEQLQKLIELLNQKEQKANSAASIKERHQMGVSYLDHLRNFNAGRKKVVRDQSESLGDISQKVVYPDYLKQQRSHSQASQFSSRIGLRKAISSQGGSVRDRYESTLDHLSLLDTQARRKETELKYMKGRRSHELRKQLDEYYIESASMNLQLLKQAVGQ